MSASGVQTLRQRWKPAEGGVLLLAGVAALAQALPRLVEEWTINPNMEHVWLTLPVGGWMAWRAWRGRGRAGEVAGPDWAAGLPLLVTGGACLFGDAALEEPMLLAAGLLLGGLGAAALLAGRGAVRALAFPAVLIAFAVPLPEMAARHVMHIHLQRFAASCSGGLLALLGVDAAVNGTVLTIDGAQLNVVEQCSGLRALTALVFAALVAGAHLLPRRPVARLVLAVGGVAAALLSNAVRLTAAGVLLDPADPERAIRLVHGWGVIGVYAVGIGFLLLLAVALQEIGGRTAVVVDGEAAP